MIQKSISIEQFIQCKVYRFAGLLQMPFREKRFCSAVSVTEIQKADGFSDNLFYNVQDFCRLYRGGCLQRSWLRSMGYHGNRFDFYTHYGNLHRIRLQT